MKCTAIVCAAALLGTVFFSCKSSIDSDSAPRTPTPAPADNPAPPPAASEQTPPAVKPTPQPESPAPSVSKITLSANDIVKVKDIVFANGKVTVENAVTSISADDIHFNTAKLDGRTPVVTFAASQTTQTLNTGDNTVVVNIKDDNNFKASTLTIKVTRKELTAPPAAPAYKITALTYDKTKDFSDYQKNPYKVKPESCLSEIADIYFNFQNKKEKGTNRSSAGSVFHNSDYHIEEAKSRLYFADQLKENTEVELKDSAGNVLGHFKYNGRHGFTPVK